MFLFCFWGHCWDVCSCIWKLKTGGERESLESSKPLTAKCRICLILSQSEAVKHLKRTFSCGGLGVDWFWDGEGPSVAIWLETTRWSTDAFMLTGESGASALLVIAAFITADPESVLSSPDFEFPWWFNGTKSHYTSKNMNEPFPSQLIRLKTVRALSVSWSKAKGFGELRRNRRQYILRGSAGISMAKKGTCPALLQEPFLSL